MDNINTLPMNGNPQTQIEQQAYLANLLQQKHLTERPSSIPQQTTQQPQTNPPKKFSPLMELKKNWIKIIVLIILFIVLSFNVIDMFLIRKLGNKSKASIVKIIIFSFFVILIFLIPVNK